MRERQPPVQHIVYETLTGEKVRFKIFIPDWVIDEIEKIADFVPDPVEGRKVAELLVTIFNVAFSRGLTAQGDVPKLEIIEALAMFDESEADEDGH